MKNLIILTLIFLLGRYAYNNFIKEEWSGYFYPNAYSLSNWIESEETFNSLESCRAWAEQEDISYFIRNYDSSEDYYWKNEWHSDYECGLNCKYKDGFNVCKETLR